MIDHKSLELEIRCRPSKLPEHIVANVAKLDVGEAIHISDLPEMEGVEFLGEPAQVLVSCQHPTIEAEPEEEETVAVAADEVPATKVSDDDDSSEGDEADKS